MNLRHVVLVLMGCAGGVAPCCAPSKEESSNRASGSGAGSQEPDAGAGTGSGDASTGASGGMSGNLSSGAGEREGGTGRFTADAACAASALEPEAIEVDETIETQISCFAEAPEPINLYIVLDNSGSMGDNGKWNDAVSAITDFVQTLPPPPGEWSCVDEDGFDVPTPDGLDPLPAGAISVAIQYFHPVDMGGGTDECSGTGHATPAVSMGPLPSNANAIVTSLGSTGPSGNTPTVGALTGGTQYCAQYQIDNPDEKCVVVLVTDGQPNGCGLSSSCGGGGSDCVDPGSAAALTPIASNAYGAANSVLTFTIGMDGVTPEGFALLDAIAVAGGSDCTPVAPGSESCNVSTSGSTGFLDALNTIRESVQASDTSTESVINTRTVSTTLPCEWEIPQVPEGETFDEGLVNVTVTISGTAQALARVSAPGDCAASKGGWYYDDPTAPSRIEVCPDTCSTLELLTDTRVDIWFGCETREATLR